MEDGLELLQSVLDNLPESSNEDDDFEHYDPYEWDGEFNSLPVEPFIDEDEAFDRFVRGE